MAKLLVIDGSIELYHTLLPEWLSRYEHITFFTSDHTTKAHLGSKVVFQRFVGKELGFKDIALVLAAAKQHDEVIMGQNLGTSTDTMKTIAFLKREIPQVHHIEDF